MEFEHSLSYLILGDPTGNHILLGQDIPEPLLSELAGDGTPAYKAVIVFYEDADNYHYIAHRLDVTQHLEMGKVNSGVKTETMHINSVGTFDVEANFIWDPTDKTAGGNQFFRNPEESDMKIDGVSESRGYQDHLLLNTASTRYNATAEGLVTGASVTATLYAGRRYAINVQFAQFCATAGHVGSYRVRKTNLAGAIQPGVKNVVQSLTTAYEDESFTAIHDCTVTGSATFVLTARRVVGAVSNIQVPTDAEHALIMSIEDIGDNQVRTA